METYRKILRGLAALAIPAAMAACDDDATGPTVTGTVSAEMHDQVGAVSAANAITTPNGTTSPAMASSFSGTASGNAQVSIYSEAEGWIDLGAPADITLDLQGSDRTTLYGSASVPAGSYTRVRLVLEGFDAQLAAGAVVGGLTLSAGASIVVGGTDGRVEIEKTVTPFTVTAESSTTIGFDLNSEAWITEESAQAQSAGDAEVQSATEAYITE